ncbi:MAG: SET domain-containing protein [Saprospiraceae bacterium]
MNQIPGLFITNSGDRGRGVFSSIEINEGDLIEVCPVIVIPKSQLPIIHKTVLHDYYFLWGEDMEDCAIALGLGSIYNHEVQPNANFILDMEHRTIDIVAIKTIEPGEEITLNYHGVSGDDEKLWF